MKKKVKNKRWPSNIGRRTGVDVVQGKKIRRQDDGTEVFEDYWSDSVSDDSNETVKSKHSPENTISDKILERVSILNRDSVSYSNAQRSFMTKTAYQSSEEYEDHNNYVRPENLNKSEISRKKLVFEDIGRRTRENVVEGKTIRKRDDGTDVYDDYLTDNSDEVVQSLHSAIKTRSGEVSDNVCKRGSVSFSKIRRSSMKENRNERNDGNFEYHDEYFSSKKPKVSRKIQFLEDEENSAIARSKMTQTSNLLDETENTEQEVPQTSNLLDGIENTEQEVQMRRKSPRKLANDSQTINRREYLSPSREEEPEKAKKRNSRIINPSSHPPFKNTTYSCDSERNLSVESCSGVSPKSLNSQKSKEVGKRNSSLRKLSHPAAKSFEGMNQMKNVTFENDMSVNESEILVSDQRENELKEMNHQKTSMGRSPIAIKRKMTQISDAMENSPSKATRLQNRLKEENKKSFSGEKSHYSAKFSESWNTKQNKNRTRSNDRINRSEISIPPQKESDEDESDQESNVEVSSVFKESRQIPDALENSPSKATRLQNQLKEVSKKSFSGEKSRYSTKFSESQNTKQNKNGTRSNNRINRSELHQKESDEDESNQESSLENSPRAYENRIALQENTPSDFKERRQILDAVGNSPSKTLRDQNRVKEGNEKNLSGNKSRHHSAESSKSRNTKQNKYKTRSISRINRSEISVLHQKESNEDESDQEFSKENSQRAYENGIALQENIPSDFKERRQVLDAVGNSPSKTLRNRNRVKEGNEKDVSGEKSRHHSTESSKSRNTKQNKNKTKHNNRINRSEISVPHQNENNQETLIEKSKKNPDNETAPQRRSSRYRRPPLASWRNERLKFVKGDKIYECVGVEEGRPEDDFAFRVVKRNSKSNIKKVRKKQKNIPKKLKKIPIINERNGKVIELYLHRPFGSYEWTLPLNEVNPGYMVTRTFQSMYMTFGFLDIAGHSIKDEQHSPQDNLHFVVVKGVIGAVINTTSFTFEKGDSFIVPVGTAYSLSNKTSQNALLSFTAFRIPFFKYQEKE